MMLFRDYETNPHSGRPEPHHSWPFESFATGVLWAMIAVMVAGGVAFYMRWGEFQGLLAMGGPALLLALIATLRRRAMKRKIEAFRRATDAFEQSLSSVAASAPE